MSNSIKLALGLAIACILVYTGWLARGWHEDATQLQITRIVDAVNEIKANQIAAIKVENKTIYNKTVELIKTEVMYLECKQDETMLQLTNYALIGK